MRALRRGITGRDIFTTEFSWEWDRGHIGVTTTDGAAIVSAAQEAGDTIRTRGIIPGVPQGADTLRITGRRTTAGRHITVDILRITVANLATMAAENRRIMVLANRRAVEAAMEVGPRVEAVEVENRPVVVADLKR